MLKQSRKIILCALLCCLAGIFLLAGCLKAAKDVTPIKIGAILSVTGGASYLGAPEAQTLEMLVNEINAGAGILGRKLKVIIKDSKGAPENAISFARQLIEEEKVLAIIGPSTSGETMSIKDVCQEGKTILLSCAAAETIVEPVAGYVFKTPQKDSYAAQRIYEIMKAKGIKNIGVVVSNDGFGTGGKAQLEKYAPENGIEIAIAEVYDKESTDLTSVLTKIRDKNVQAIINWSIVPAQSIIAKNMKQLGMTIPLFQSHGFGNIKYVTAAGEAAEGIIFPCGRLLVADMLPDGHPQKALLVKYNKDYSVQYGEDASTFGGHAYDALMILLEAIKQAGAVEPEKVRAAIEAIKDFPGTGGIFNFSAADHNGLDINSFDMLTVKNGKFALYNE